MKRLSFLFCFLACLSVFVSCDGNGLQIDKPRQILYVRIGYDTDISELNGRFDGKLGAMGFVAFADAETVAQGAEGLAEGFGDMSVQPGRFPFPKDGVVGEGKLRVKVFPEDAIVKSIHVTSSDTDVMQVTGVSGTEVSVKCGTLGETTLKVTVNGSVNSVTTEFPVSVVGTCEMDFNIPPFWQGEKYVRLFARTKELPYGSAYRSVALQYKDSVEVCGYCEFYRFNEKTERLDKHVVRDTIRLATEERVALFRPYMMSFIRNITPAFWSMTARTVAGQARFGGMVVDADYHYSVESVILHFMVYGADPYIEFNFNSMCNRTVINYEYDEEGLPIDQGADKDIDYDQGSYRSLVEHESPFFRILLNDFLSQDERILRSKELSDKLKEKGYDENAMSDGEKEALLESLNQQ